MDIGADRCYFSPAIQQVEVADLHSSTGIPEIPLAATDHPIADEVIDDATLQSSLDMLDSERFVCQVGGCAVRECDLARFILNFGALESQLDLIKRTPDSCSLRRLD